jgi:hypothetical protein
VLILAENDGYLMGKNRLSAFLMREKQPIDEPEKYGRN